MSFVIGRGTLILIGHAMADGVVEQDCDLARRGRYRLLLAYAR